MAEPQRILVVDDEEPLRRVVARQLTQDGYVCNQAASAEEAWAKLQSGGYALVVSDILMPGTTGMELLERMREAHDNTAVIMVTGVDDRHTAIRALQLGAYGYVIKPFDLNELSINVANALERRRLIMQRLRYERDLEDEVQARTAEVRATQEEITLRLANVTEYRDDETGAHIKRLGSCASIVAARLGWRGRMLDDIRLAAPMHDIGKVAIPDSILRKPGKLTPGEFEIMKLHTVFGAKILAGASSSLLKMATDIALCHQEKWDGSGYPGGLAGDAIPISARIVAVADVFDAMTHDRVYRPAFSEEKALEIMKSESGKHFDPAVLDAFLAELDEYRKIREEISSETTQLSLASLKLGHPAAPH